MKANDSSIKWRLILHVFFLIFVIIEGNDSGYIQNKPNSLGPIEASHGMEIAQLLLSLLHTWGLDNDLDRVCQVKLGLLRPMVNTLFSLLIFMLSIKFRNVYFAILLLAK